jgi:DNA-binding NarL/FixJ family response regulator
MFTKFIKKINPDKKNIFIVEDNELYAKTLQTFIYNSFPNIQEINIFNIGEMCLMEMHRNPTIVIMDYFLNSQYEQADNGLEIIKRIKIQKPQTNIIVLSAQENFQVVLDAIKQYDCIYVQKNDEAFTKVKQFIKEIFNRKKPASIES